MNLIEKKKWTQIALVILFFGLIVRMLTLNVAPLGDPSEGRYAMVSRDMAMTNDYVTPMIWMKGIYMPYLGKPPLYFWLGSISFKLFGMGEFAARFPSFFSAIGILLLTYLIIKRYKTYEIAILSLIIMLTTGSFYIFSGIVLMDMTLTLFCSSALLFYYAFLVEKNPSYQKLLSIGVFISLGLGFLSKGPVAILIFGIPVFLWHLINKRWKILKNHAWITGIVLFLAITIPWFWIAELKTPGFLEYFFLHENFYRFFKEGYGDLYGHGHKYPLGTAILFFIVTATPWSLVAIYLLIEKFIKSSNNLKMRLKKVFIMIKIDDLKGSYRCDFFLISFVTIVLFWCVARQIHIYYLLLPIPLFSVWMASFIDYNKISISKILKFSLVTLLIYGISTFFIRNIISESKCSKGILSHAVAIKEDEKCYGDIVFLRKTPYSAYFYGEDVILKHKRESIEKSLLRTSSKANLYIIKEKYYKKLNSELKRKFEIIYSSKKWKILKKGISS